MMLTREKLKELLPIMQAFAEGKSVEYMDSDGLWWKTENPIWEDGTKYRIQPEIKYRPFKSKEECWSEMMKHTPFGWVSSKNEEATAFVYFICTNYIRVNDGYSINGWCFNYEEMFDKYTFGDGTPFGINEAHLFRF